MNGKTWIRGLFRVTESPPARRASTNWRCCRYVPLLETLEQRTVPDGAVPSYMVGGSSSSPLIGLTPSQIRTAYTINNISEDGAGETIAIVDAYNNTHLVSMSDSAFSNSDLHQFDTSFAPNLAEPSGFFTKVNQLGNSVSTDPSDPNYVPTNPNDGSAPAGYWQGEEALDVEWTHAIAPGASIILVEAKSHSLTDLLTAAHWAATPPSASDPTSGGGAQVVLMSWGGDEDEILMTKDPVVGLANETMYDNQYLTQPSTYGVTYVSSSGDTGDYSGSQYPASSPDVLAVGGTTLTTDSTGDYTAEKTWGATGTQVGSGGETSYWEPQPAYQKAVVPPSMSGSRDGVANPLLRTTADVSFDADPSTGVSVYDSYNGQGTNWRRIGGTSVGSACWAGIIAIADEYRSNLGLPSLDGPSQTLPYLYGLPSTAFNDITTGSNDYFPAIPGYDIPTGLGTPIVKYLVPDLTKLFVIAQTPANGVSVATPPTTYRLNFSEPIDASSLRPDALTINDSPADEVNVDSSGLFATFTFDNNPVSTPGVQTISVAAGAISSGTMTNARYSATFTYDPLPALAALQPAGSLAYESSANSTILYPDSSDQYTFAADPGQTLTVAVTPSATLEPDLQITAPNGPLTTPDGRPVNPIEATHLGQSAFLQATPLFIGGTYTITVDGTGTTGAYTVQIYLDAAVESASVLGGSDNTLLTAQNLDNSIFQALPTPDGSATSVAVVGTLPSPATVVLASNASGDYDSDGNHDVGSSVYVVGSTGQTGSSGNPLEYRNFFTFDTDQLSAAIHSASLQLTNPLHGYSGWQNSAASDTFGLFDATAEPAYIGDLVNSTSDQTIFDNLESSPSSDEKIVTAADDNTVITVPLNAYALGVLNSSLPINVGSGTFAIGGTLTSLTQFYASQYLFYGSGSADDIKQLTLTLEPTTYYSFTVADNEPVTVGLKMPSGNGASFTIVPPSDKSISVTTHSTGNLDEDVSFTPPLGGGGTYYIKVTADHSISYRLVITRGASFDAKTNGAFSTAQDITGTSGALGDLASGTQDWYRISLPGLQSLEAEAIPPLDGANQPLNGLYPILQLYSASDMHTALASAALLPDGRSQFLRYSGLTASSSYYLKVSSTATAGEYFLGMVVNPPLEITTPSLSSSLLQSAFNQTIQTFGGTGTLTFSTSGNVPSWLSVTTSGVLEGTPTGTGSSTFTVTVTDATNQSCSRSYTVNIVDPTSPSGNYLPSTASANVLQVTSFYSSPSGFSVQFNGPFLVAPTTPVLYSTGYGTSARKASVLLTQGTIASGTAVLGTGSSAGKVVSVMIPTGEGGSLYGDPAYDPNSYVLFVAGGGSGATGVANVTSGQVTSVTINSGGGGYMSAPTVSFTGGGGSGATGIATINANWQVTGVTITNFGSGYTSTPTVVFSPGSGSGAAGAVNVSSGHITSVTITNEGSGYTSPPSIIFSVPDPVEGSLVLDPVNNTLTFVETDTASQVNNGTPILPDGKYTAIIRGIAATDGLQAGWNNAYLDGLGTGFAGSGDFTATFTINGAQDDIVWVPATGDGPGQALNAPGGNAANGGYPVYINDNTGAVTSVELTLNYNPALLTINEVPGQSVNNPALPGSSFQLVSNDNGVAVFKYTDTGGNNASHLKGVKKILGYILASVPSGTAASPMFYGSTEILHLSNVSINGSTNGVASADAVHLVAYVGDADDAIHILGYIGTAWLTGIYGDNTTQLIINTMLNENTGFAAYALVDPVIIADTDGVGYIPSDAALQIEELLGGFPSLLGAIPTGTYIVF